MRFPRLVRLGLSLLRGAQSDFVPGRAFRAARWCHKSISSARRAAARATSYRPRRPDRAGHQPLSVPFAGGFASGSPVRASPANTAEEKVKREHRLRYIRPAGQCAGNGGAPSARQLPQLLRERSSPQLARGLHPQFAVQVFGASCSLPLKGEALFGGRARRRMTHPASFPAALFRGCSGSGSAALLAQHSKTETEGNETVKTVEAAVIGVGWVGGTRAETLSRTALVDKLHLCEIKPDRLAEVKKLYKPATATLKYQDIIDNPNISVVSTFRPRRRPPTIRSAARLPENRQERDAGKSIRARTVGADELDPTRQAQQSEIHHRLFAAFQHQDRLSAKKKITDGTLGVVTVSVLVSRNLSRRPRQEDRRSRAAIAGSDGPDPTISTSCSGCWNRPSPVRV